MMKNILIGALSVLLLMAVSAYGFLRTGPRMAYVEVGKIYNEFTLKKELEAKLTNVKSARKLLLDSMELRLNGLAIRLQSAAKPDEEMMNEFEQLRSEFRDKSNRFAEDNERTAQQYDEQIWTQINQYIRDYGKEHRLTYILGADGAGAVMYADEAENITAAINAYVNQRYAGMGK